MSRLRGSLSRQALGVVLAPATNAINSIRESEGLLIDERDNLDRFEISGLLDDLRADNNTLQDLASRLNTVQADRRAEGLLRSIIASNNQIRSRLRGTQTDAKLDRARAFIERRESRWRALLRLL